MLVSSCQQHLFCVQPLGVRKIPSAHQVGSMESELLIRNKDINCQRLNSFNTDTQYFTHQSVHAESGGFFSSVKNWFKFHAMNES